MALDLRNCDCMELMKEYPDKYFDLAIVDPPYGIDYLHSGGLGTNCVNKKHNRRWYDRKNWDLTIPNKEYFTELFRVSKNQIIWGANYFTEHLPPSMGWIFWDKGQNLSMSDGELAFTSFQVAMRRKVINRVEILKDGAIHPTQKPTKLYKWILDKYAEPGQKILDTHLGSMSIAIACHDYGFDLTGCEIDKQYFDTGMKRVQNHVSQLSLLH